MDYVNVLGAQYTVVVVNLEGFGLMAGRTKMLRANAAVDPVTGIHVCAPPHLDGGCALEAEDQCTALGKSGGCEQLMSMDMKPGDGYLVSGTKEGGTFEGCRRLALDTALSTRCSAEKNCILEQWAPPMLPAMPIYVTQWMQRRPQQAGVANRRRLFPYHTVPARLTAEMLAAAAERACGVPAESLASGGAGGDVWRRLLLGWSLSEDGEISAESAAWLCTDLSYLYELLVRGMHVPTNSPIHLIGDAPPNLVGVEVAWILGDALLSLQARNNTNVLEMF